MDLISNSVGSSKVGVLTLSGFGAKVRSDTVEKLFQLLGENGMSASTFEKPGSGNRAEEYFSFASLQQGIQSATVDMLERHDQVLFVGNSMTFIPFVQAAKLLGDKISKLVGISPVCDPMKAIINHVNFFGMDISELTPVIVDQVAKSLGVTIDSTFFKEITEHSRTNEIRQLIHALPINVELFLNPQDRIIDPNFVEEIGTQTGATIIRTDSIPGNPTHHAIKTSDIIPYILKHNILCEDSVN